MRGRTLARRLSLLWARSVAALSMPTIILSRLVKDGWLRRVDRDMYARPDLLLSEHISLTKVTLRVSKVVSGLLSALRVYSLGAQTPHQVWQVIAQNLPTPCVEDSSLRPTHMSGRVLSEGVQEMQVFNAAKAIVASFKYRNKICIDVALKALCDSREQRKVPMDELSYYKDINRLSNVMRPYMESVIA